MHYQKMTTKTTKVTFNGVYVYVDVDYVCFEAY